MSVLITGAAGFVGSHVVEALLGAGEDVVGLDNFDDFYDPRIKDTNLNAARGSKSFHEFRGDILDPQALLAIPEQVDEVIHLAARAGVRPSIEHPELYSQVNVLGTTRLLQWSVDRGIRRFIFASSSSVYGNNDKVPFSETDPVDTPISPYAATKRAGELLCHTFHHLYGLDVVALRFFTAYGPRQRPDLAIHKFARLLKRGEPIPMYGDGSSERDYTYISDIVHGVLRARAFLHERTGVFEIFNLGENRTVPLREAIDTLAETMGVTPRIDRQPEQPGDVRRTYADISKSRTRLGYDPGVGFHDGIKAFVDWFEATQP